MTEQTFYFNPNQLRQLAELMHAEDKQNTLEIADRLEAEGSYAVMVNLEAKTEDEAIEKARKFAREKSNYS